tara:strand:- start:8 stop:694 length:687 start_codon:yes stop_codon:yes gene_type:complete
MLQGVKTMNDTDKNESIKRQQRALELKLEGESTRSIAKQLKVSHSTIQRDIKLAIDTQYEVNADSINYQRNKITAILNKILDSQMKYAVGYEEVTGKSILGITATYDADDLEYDRYFKSEYDEHIPMEDHMYLEDHYADESQGGLMNCKCKQVTDKKSPAEIAEIKQQWHAENVTFTAPSTDAIKIVLDVSKQLASIWGVNITMPKEPTYYDQRNQTIQIKEDTNGTI